MRKFILSALSALALIPAWAGDKFVARDMGSDADMWYTLSTMQRGLSRQTFLYQLFDYPNEIVAALNEKYDGIWTKVKPADLEELGAVVTVETTATREGFFKTAGFNTAGAGGATLIIQALCKDTNSGPGIEGDGRVDIHVDYKGERTTQTYQVHFRYYIAKDDELEGDNEKPIDIDYSYNDIATNNTDKTFKRSGTDTIVPYTIEFVTRPKYGDVEFKIKKYRNHLGNFTTAQVMIYTPRPGTPNYCDEVFRIRKIIPKENDTKNLTEDYAVEKNITLHLHKNPYPTRIVEFMPAPGQFVNSAEAFNYPGAQMLLGVDADGNTVEPDPAAMISLGGFGGYIVFGFDQPVTNDPRHPYGVDFTIVGNSFEPWEKGWWCEPAAVQVMEDKNGDGIPNDGEWYELAGSDYWLRTTHRNISMTYYNPKYDGRYTVPWTTSDGRFGALVTNNYHNQPYFPLPECYPGAQRDSMTYYGSQMMCSPDKRVPSYIEFTRAPAFGYADNKGNYNKDNLFSPLNPYCDDERGKSSDGFDLSWAVDKNGNYVELEKVDFIKVYTAGQFNAGWLGEWSAEVCKVVLTSPDESWVPKDIYINYIGLNQIQVPVGESYDFEGFVFKNGRPVSEGTPRWWVDDQSVATVDNTGKFTGLKVGKTNLHFRQYEGAPEDVVEIEVVEIKGVMIDLEGNASVVSNDYLTCVTGEKVYINVESLTTCTEVMNGTMSNRYIYDTYRWDNSNPEAGTIDNGLFTALKPGKTTLTVHSDHGDDYTDAIVITVVDPSAPYLLVESLKIPAGAPEGEIALSELVANERGATVYLKSVQTMCDGIPVEAGENNTLVYDFSAKPYHTGAIKLVVTCYGADYTFMLPVVYGPDQSATPQQLIGLSGTDLVGSPIAETAAATVKYASSVATAGNIAAEGAYVWVASDNAIVRYEVANGEIYSQAALTNAGNHPIVIMDDKVLVADGCVVRSFYKTDLTEAPVKVEFNEPVVAMSLYNYDNKMPTYDPSTLYLLTGTETLTLRKVALKDCTVGEHSLNLHTANAAIVAGSDSYVYVITAPDAIERISLNSAQEENEAPAGPFVGKLIVAASTGTAGNILVANDEGGFNSWAKSSRTFAAAPVMVTEGAPVVDVVTGSVKSGYSTAAVYYVRCQGEDVYREYNSKYAATGNVAAATDFAAVAFMAEVAENDNPQARDTKAVEVHEYEAKSTYQSVTPNVKDYNDASSYSKSYKLYARNISDFPWITGFSLYPTSISFSTQYTGRVDEEQTVNIVCEAIDEAGGSAMFNIPVKLTPWLYKPHITPRDIEIDCSNGDVDYMLDMGSIFMLADNPHLTEASYHLPEDANVPSPAGTDYFLDPDNSQILHITAQKGTNAEFEVTVARVDHFIHDNEEIASYGIAEGQVPDKEYPVALPVKVVYVDGISSAVASSAPEISYDAATRRIYAAAEGTMRVYDVAGALVINARNTAMGVDASMLPAGVYIVRIASATERILVR